MIIVYHIASMGNWQQVVSEQLDLLVRAGLGKFPLYITHVGLPSDTEWVLATARTKGLNPVVDRRDDNIMHYETFAMLLIERLTKHEKVNEPILYFHTKGVSASWHRGKRNWRLLMEREVLSKWREHLPALEANDIDAVGVNWCQWNDPHFSGNFWIARADWLRGLPDYVTYHHSKNLVRTSCEFWIGSANGIRPKSLCCSGHTMFDDRYDWSQHFSTDQPPTSRVNLGSGNFPLLEWTNVDIRPDVFPDVLADVNTCEFPENSVSEIYCGHLLEHTADPLGFLRRCHKWLRPGSKLTVTVPDFGVSAAMYHGQMPLTSAEFTGDRIVFGLTQPPEQRHLQAFTPGTLSPLFAMAGFRSVTQLTACSYWAADVPWQFSISGEK